MTTVTTFPSELTPKPENDRGRLNALSGLMPSRSPSTLSKGYDQYSVQIQSTPVSPRFEVPPTPRGASTTQVRNNRAAMEANTAAWGYTKVALLFFISLLVTWVCHLLRHLLFQNIFPRHWTNSSPSTGPLLHQPRLLPPPPLPCLPPFHLRLRHGPPPHGLLELRHLHHHLLGCRPHAFQRATIER